MMQTSALIKYRIGGKKPHLTSSDHLLHIEQDGNTKQQTNSFVYYPFIISYLIDQTLYIWRSSNDAKHPLI